MPINEPQIFDKKEDWESMDQVGECKNYYHFRKNSRFRMVPKARVNAVRARRK